jgi:hypothetical protein
MLIERDAVLVPIVELSGAVADTIHREEDGIGTCNLRFKQPTAIFDTAIVVNEFGTRILCEHLKLRH